MTRQWSGRSGNRSDTSSQDDQRLMVVRYDARTASFAAPRQWSAVRLADTGVLPNFDLAPSDGRVLALLPAAPPYVQRGNHATVLLGFFDEARRRLERR